MTLKEFQLARQLSAQHTERWEAIGNEVVTSTGERIGLMRGPTYARLVASVHNVFLPVANRLLHALKRLQDTFELEKGK